MQRHSRGGRWQAATLVAFVTGCPADDPSGEDTGADTTAATDSTTDDSGVETEGATTVVPATTGTAACPDCGVGLWCDWGVNSCGGETDEGTCEPVPMGCDAVYQPVCGCDGTVYGNECEAHSAGVDVAELNDCTPPRGAFPCGQTFCDLATSYCQVSGSDIGGEPNGYGCAPLPAACGDAPTCDCLAGESCFDFGCAATPEGGLSITCPGG